MEGRIPLMIIADNNIIVPIFLDEPHSSTCEELYEKEARWITPYLWQSEFKHVLTRSVKIEQFTIEGARQVFETADSAFSPLQQAVDHKQSFDLSLRYRLSGYDGEYVWLAENLQLPLVTFDKEVLKRASHVAVHPEEYLAS